MENSQKKTGNDNLPHHPHDMLFKAVFKSPNRAVEVLKVKLTEELLPILKLDTLRLDDGSYVDEKLAEHIADINFLCDTNDGDSVQLSLILEHKSYLPTFPPLQIMGYQQLAWNRQVQPKYARPIPIIPIVFFHGKEKWTVKLWPEYLKGWKKEFEQYTPSGGYIFIDLSNITDEEIRRFRSGFLITALLLMKHRFERQFLLDNLFEIVSFVESDSNEDLDRRIEYLQYILRYLQGLEAIQWKETKEKLNLLKITSHVMNVLEDIKIEARQEGIALGIEEGIKKGIKKGIEQGIEENKYHASYKMLKEGLKLPFISNVMDISIELLEDLQKNLVHEPNIISLLKENKNSLKEIADQVKVSVLLVKVIKKEMEKNKR